MDAGKPVAFESSTGEKLFSLKHGSGVSEVFFTHDDKLLVSGSRDNTAKIWDTSNTTVPVHNYNVKDWVSSVLVKPSNPDRLFAFSRNGDIYIYDINFR